MKRHPLIAFFCLSFAITWSLGAVVILFGEPLAARFGDIDLRRPFWKALVHTATYAPAISALIVIRVWRGPGAIAQYARRIFQFRAGLGWYAAVFVAYPLLHQTCTALANWRHPEGAVPLFDIHPWYAIVPIFLVHLFDDPGGMEELGWRGFALPLLQQRMSALNASLVLGFIWGIWHLPAFYISAMSQSTRGLWFFVGASMVLSILMTAVYNGSGGSIPLLFLMHSIGNFNYGREGSPPAEQFWQLVVLLVVAGALVAWRGKDFGLPKWTRVLPDDPAPG